MIVGQMVKEPHEEITVGIDFTVELIDGETVDTAEVTSRSAVTLLDTSSAFLSQAAAEILTPVVSKRCQGGAHGETHLVQMRAVTSLGNSYEHEVEVMVVES